MSSIVSSSSHSVSSFGDAAYLAFNNEDGSLFGLSHVATKRGSMSSYESLQMSASFSDSESQGDEERGDDEIMQCEDDEDIHREERCSSSPAPLPVDQRITSFGGMPNLLRSMAWSMDESMTRTHEMMDEHNEDGRLGNAIVTSERHQKDEATFAFPSLFDATSCHLSEMLEETIVGVQTMMMDESDRNSSTVVPSVDYATSVSYVQEPQLSASQRQGDIRTWFQQ